MIDTTFLDDLARYSTIMIISALIIAVASFVLFVHIMISSYNNPYSDDSEKKRSRVISFSILTLIVLSFLIGLLPAKSMSDSTESQLVDANKVISDSINDRYHTMSSSSLDRHQISEALGDDLLFYPRIKVEDQQGIMHTFKLSFDNDTGIARLISTDDIPVEYSLGLETAQEDDPDSPSED